MKVKYDGVLESWVQDQVTKKEFIVWGYIYGDKKQRFRDGQSIHTSGIKNRALAEGDIIATRNSVYKLGVPLEDSHETN